MNKTGLWWGLLLIWAVAAIWITSSPTSFFEGIYVAGALLLLTLAWLVRVILAARSGEGRNQRLVSLGLEALGGVAVVTICSLDVPQKVRFHLSEPALTAYAKQQLAHPTGSQTPVRIGLYTFRRIEATQDEVHLEIGNAFFDSVGFSYSFKYPSKDARDFSYEHIHGPWYKRTDSW